MERSFMQIEEKCEPLAVADLGCDDLPCNRDFTATSEFNGFGGISRFNPCVDEYFDGSPRFTNVIGRADDPIGFHPGGARPFRLIDPGDGDFEGPAFPL